MIRIVDESMKREDEMKNKINKDANILNRLRVYLFINRHKGAEKTLFPTICRPFSQRT
jgi:hypothetical protein